jgi:acyl dehydratase
LHQLTWFNMAVHSNSEYAKNTWFKERSLAAPVIFVVADGLIHHADTIAYLLEGDGYEIYAYVGVDNVKITSPVLFGDTLTAEAEVVDFRPTKNPEMNLFVYKNKCFNQRGQQVIEYQSSMLAKKKA